jgi:hypothetical protein
MQTKTKRAAKKKEATPTSPTSSADASSERYEKRDSGFVLVKVLKGGTVVETPLSNFTASVIAEFHRVDHRGETRVDGFAVEAKFKDWVKVFNVAAIPHWDFDKRLLEAASSVHPMTFITPGKQNHVINSIKQTSSPRIFVKNGDGKTSTINTRKGNREA